MLSPMPDVEINTYAGTLFIFHELCVLVICYIYGVRIIKKTPYVCNRRVYTFHRCEFVMYDSFRMRRSNTLAVNI